MNEAATSLAVEIENRWKPYPVYKDSGIQWLGEVPAHWEVKRLKHVCWRTALYGANESAGSYLDEGIRFLRTSDIDDNGKLDPSNAVYLEQDLVRDYILEDGDLLLSRSGTLGRSFIYYKNLHGACSYAGYLVRFSLTGKMLPSFAFHFTKSRHFLDWMGISVIQSTIGNVNGQKYANMSITTPPHPEQQAIVKFLDRETTHIDTLIAKKERLIELLTEKRSALISHIVIRGLDSTVPMKDSGVEWLGEIPAHWDFGELRRYWKIIDCKHRTATYVDDGIPIVSTTEVKPGRLSLSNTRMTTREDYLDLIEGERLPKRGDIIYSRNASLGSAAYVDTDEEFCMGQDVCLITSSNQDQSFLTYQLNSTVILQQLEAVMVGATFNRINIAQIKVFLVTRPPFEEQCKITDFLNHETSKIDTLSSKVREHIERLKEYRTALISAAVTGKIDVREEVA